MVALDWSFWAFVQNPKYHGKIGDIIRNWEDYKEKYRQSDEPIEQIKSVQDKARTEQTGGFADIVDDYSIMESRVMDELCKINQGEELIVDEVLSFRKFDRRKLWTFLRYFEKRPGYIEIRPNGRIRLTDFGRTQCPMSTYYQKLQ